MARSTTTFSTLSRPATGLALLALLAAISPTPAYQAQAPSSSRTFPETGKTVQGRFLDYWDDQRRAGAAGLPHLRRDAGEERRPTARLIRCSISSAPCSSSTPRTSAPYDVLLSLLGSTSVQAEVPERRAWPEAEHSGKRSPRSSRRPGKRVGGEFLQLLAAATAGWRSRASPSPTSSREERPRRQDLHGAVLRARGVRAAPRERRARMTCSCRNWARSSTERDTRSRRVGDNRLPRPEAGSHRHSSP